MLKACENITSGMKIKVQKKGEDFKINEGQEIKFLACLEH